MRHNRTEGRALFELRRGKQKSEHFDVRFGISDWGFKKSASHAVRFNPLPCALVAEP
jgi:hypothetical protein